MLVKIHFLPNTLEVAYTVLCRCRFIHDHLHLYYPELQLPLLDIRPKVQTPETLKIIPGVPLVPKKRRRKKNTPPEPDPPREETVPEITID
jgi:hypothetical protein